jgi:Trypsin-like peptidase domain
MKKWLVPLITCTLLLTAQLPVAAAGAAPNSPATQTLSVKDIARYSDRVVKIYALDENGEEIATGSGFVVTSDGEIVTNHHVIDEAVKLKIEFSNKQTYETDQTLLVDAKRDLALLKINATRLPFVTLGDSTQMEIGDPVVAVGSPLGYENTVSNGLISGIRYFDDEDLDYLQTTASVTNGSSGGVIFNLHGEVIGVTTKGFPLGGDISFAIPSQAVIHFLAQPKHPQSVTAATAKDKPEDEPMDDFERLMKIEDKLNTEFSTYKNPQTGEQENLQFYADFDYNDYGDSDEQIVNLTLNLESAKLYNYLIGDLSQQNSMRTSDLLGKALKIAHDEGGKNLTLTFYYNTQSRKLSNNLFPGDSVDFQESTGYFQISHVFAWAALDDKTGDMTYLLQPGQNDVEQHAKLFTP